MAHVVPDAIVPLPFDGRTHETGIPSLSERLARVAYRHPRWYMRFIKSQRCYLEARHQVSKNEVHGVLPDLESYIEQGRDASGFRMALDMVQYAGDMNIPDALLGDAMFARLHDHACDIAVWSMVGGPLFVCACVGPITDVMMVHQGHCIVCQGCALETRGEYHYDSNEGKERAVGVCRFVCGDTCQAERGCVRRD